MFCNLPVEIAAECVGPLYNIACQCTLHQLPQLPIFKEFPGLGQCLLIQLCMQLRQPQVLLSALVHPSRQAVARMLLIAAIEAVQANGGRINLPPKFIVHDDSPFTATRFNEPKPSKHK